MFPRYCAWGVFLAVMAVAGCKSTGEHNLPPAERLMHPGPGVGGPGPGVLPPPHPFAGRGGPGGMGMGGPGGLPCGPGGPGGGGGYFGTAQVLFVGPDSMQVHWDVAAEGQFDSVPMVTPGRQNFPQGGIYRLKLTHIPGRAGVELYPTVEVGYTTPRSKAFLTHNAIPIQFSEEDFDQVVSNNFVTKVIYLPDPDFQDLALAGVETLVSTRLDPGVDPIVEADRRGAILAVLRIGNVDLEMPGGEQYAGDEIIQASHVAGATYDASIGGSYGRSAGANCGSAGCAPGGGGGYGYPGVGGVPYGGPLPVQPAPAAPGYVSGVTSPIYGMPSVGTPIGLPGPPHVPLGIPAGLRKHKMVNHTHVHLPEPSRSINMDVKHKPGLSYPMPATDVRVKETFVTPTPTLHQPLFHKFRRVP